MCCTPLSLVLHATCMRTHVSAPSLATDDPAWRSRACWTSGTCDDICPVFASMSLSVIGACTCRVRSVCTSGAADSSGAHETGVLFECVSQACVEETFAKEGVVMAVAPGEFTTELTASVDSFHVRWRDVDMVVRRLPG